jgi:rhodanese-related sulfurtransferase
MNYIDPKYQEFTLSGVRHISPFDAHAVLLSGKAVLVDLREENEYVEGFPAHDEVILFPLSLARNWPFTSETLHIVMCAHGIRSVRVCNWLYNHGITNVVSLDGGFEQWKLMKLPVKFL